jgi:uncharacterized membrane protein YgdD (TMEM256/DUF423 family)
MHKRLLIIAAIIGAVSVAMGAFGAHLLKEIVSEKSLATFETAVRYQFYHVFAIALSGILYQSFPNTAIVRAGYCFLAGIFLFSGSLYLLAVLSPGYRWLGAITPFGGVCFITGWLFLVAGIRIGKGGESGKL